MKGIQTSLLAILGLICIGGCFNSGGRTVRVQMLAGDMFSPVNADARAGDTVEWLNSGSMNHTVEPDTAVPNMDSDPSFPAGLAPGQKFRFKVPNGTPVGTMFFYHCRFHGAPGNGSSLGTGMAGSITVVQ